MTKEKTEDRNLVDALWEHWVGPLPLRYDGEILDGRRRLEAWRRLGRPDPPYVEPGSFSALLVELAKRRHWERAQELLDRSHLAGCTLAELRHATGLPLTSARAILVRRNKSGSPKNRSYRQSAVLVHTLRELLRLHDEEERPITAEDLRNLLQLWDARQKSSH